MKVVFDTNILLSAFLTRGGAAQQLFARTIATHTLITSERILQEAGAKLSGKLQIPDREIGLFMRYVRTRMNVFTLSSKVPEIDFQDSDDIPILHLLEAAGIHYFVTGDKKLLDLKKHKQTLILSLREALELL